MGNYTNHNRAYGLPNSHHTLHDGLMVVLGITLHSMMVLITFLGVSIPSMMELMVFICHSISSIMGRITFFGFIIPWIMGLIVLHEAIKPSIKDCFDVLWVIIPSMLVAYGLPRCYYAPCDGLMAFFKVVTPSMIWLIPFLSSYASFYL